MNKIKFDNDIMKIISMFESLTRVDVKDCVVEPERIVVIVPQNQASKAVGRNGANVRKLESILNRKLKIVEFNSELTEFTKNLIYPFRAKEVSEQNGEVTITPIDLQTRGHLIGRSAKQLRATENLIKRHFGIREVKVV
jgi:N utilization substance protein A